MFKNTITCRIKKKCDLMHFFFFVYTKSHYLKQIKKVLYVYCKINKNTTLKNFLKIFEKLFDNALKMCYIMDVAIKKELKIMKFKDLFKKVEIYQER